MRLIYRRFHVTAGYSILGWAFPCPCSGMAGQKTRICSGTLGTFDSVVLRRLDSLGYYRSIAGPGNIYVKHIFSGLLWLAVFLGKKYNIVFHILLLSRRK